MSQRWEEALDAQLENILFWDSDLGKQFGQNYAEDVIKKKSDSILPDEFYNGLAKHCMNMLFEAEPIYIDPDMMTLFEAAWPKFQPERVQETDVITPSGFALLPRPVTLLDINGGKTTFRAISWYPTTYQVPHRPSNTFYPNPGLIVCFYHNTHDKDDFDIPQLGWNSNWLLGHVLPLMFNVKYEFGETVPSDRDISRPLQCLWRLMAQDITVHTKERASHAFRRRWTRRNLPEKHVTVIRLRRPRQQPDEDHVPHNIEWSHRWLVSGHWRNQWYATLNTHRQIWINPYIKGPEDQPLKVRTLRAWEWVR